MIISKNEINILAIVNIILVFVYWIIDILHIIFSSLDFFIPIPPFYFIFMFASSLLVFLKHVEAAVTLQIVGSIIHIFGTLGLVGVYSAFSNQTFLEYILNNPLSIYSIFLIFGFWIIVVGFIIFLRNQNPPLDQYTSI